METTVNLNHFICDNCKRYLKPPISQCVQGHMLCSICFNTATDKCHRCDDQLSMVVNKNFGQLVKRFFFPCSFAENGCDEKIKWTGIEKHEKQCQFKNVECPLSSVENCDWKGPNTKLENHFCDTHQESLLIAVDDVVTLTLDNLKEIQKVFLIVAHNTVFLCNFIPSNKTGYLDDVVVRFAGTEDCFGQYGFELKLMSENGDNSIIFNGTVHSNGTDDFTSIEKTLICNWHLFSSFKCQIKIIDSAQNSKSDSFVLDQITCYECKKYAKSPIFSYCSCHTWCKNCATTSSCNCLSKHRCDYCKKDNSVNSMLTCSDNHIICGDCKYLKNINKCWCKKMLSYKSEITIDNMHESLYNRAIAPCPFVSFGCVKTFKVKEGLEHDCKFGKCAQCGWKGKLTDLLLHVEEKHELMTNGVFSKSADGNFGYADCYYLDNRTIGVNGKAFVLHYIKNRELKLRHFVVQAYSDHSHYKYTITVGIGYEFMTGTQICTSIFAPYQDDIDSGKAITFPECKIKSLEKATILVERIVAE